MKKAFTLIELLVVIAIIAILAAILFPVFAQAKLAAKKTQGLSNIKQTSTGMLIYSNDADDNFPIGSGNNWYYPRDGGLGHGTPSPTSRATRSSSTRATPRTILFGRPGSTRRRRFRSPGRATR